MIQIRKAQRKKAKFRLGLVGPSGSGKTYSSLLIAKGLGGKVGLIDTENGSGDLYSDLMNYDIITLSAPFEIKKYLDCMKAFEDSGYDTIIMDSLSHAWAGQGGLLDKHAKISESGRGNSYTAWRMVTPDHNLLVESILQSKCNVIATMRAKTEYVIEKNEKGREAPKKIGLSPVQRDGMDYEFTTVFDIDLTHTAHASKDRTGIFDGQWFPIGEETGKKMLDWINSGSDEAPKTIIAAVAPIKKEIKSGLEKFGTLDMFDLEGKLFEMSNAMDLDELKEMYTNTYQAAIYFEIGKEYVDRITECKDKIKNKLCEELNNTAVG